MTSSSTPHTIIRVSIRLLAILAMVLTLLTICILYVSNQNNAAALSGASFNPGRIIDDQVFYNSSSMSASEIQQFLDAKNPSCDYNGTQPASDWGYPNLTHAQFAEKLRTGAIQISGVNGASFHAPPYKCTRMYSQNTPQMEAASGLCSSLPAYNNRSGAQIIKDVADACGINPQVLIILLEKEQSLITDKWPLNIQLEKATGFACPDTAPCNPAYGGFFYQIYNAARQFKVYQKYPNNYNYVAGRSNKVYYQTNLGEFINPTGNTTDSSRNGRAGCGYNNIQIQNQATAALYIYTPYQPNQTALNNLYGTGDSCSAYGNRNFWRLFSDWFGSTTGKQFSAQYRARSTNIRVEAGETKSVYMQFINNGRAFWKDDASTFPGYQPVRLAATNPINRSSIFKSSNWLSSSRPNGTFSKVLRSDGWNLTQDQHTVHNGEIAEFQFNISVPSDAKSGTYREYFQPILEGTTNFDLGAWTYIDIVVTEKTHNAGFVSQTSPYPTMVNGEQRSVNFKLRNTGTATWRDNTSIEENQLPVRLAATWPINRPSTFRSSDWLSSSRPNGTFSKVYLADGVTLSPDQHRVLPNQIAEYSFNLTVPANTKAGTYREYFQPILEGAQKYEMGVVMHLDIKVENQRFSAGFISQSNYPTISRGSSQDVTFKLRNNGNMFWKDDRSTFPGYSPTRMATAGPINRPSAFKSNDWISSSRTNGVFTRVYLADGVTLSPDQHTVHPGQVAEYTFKLSVPSNAKTGTYREYFQPILEGAASYDMGLVLYLDVKVQ